MHKFVLGSTERFSTAFNFFDFCLLVTRCFVPPVLGTIGLCLSSNGTEGFISLK